MRKRKKKEIVDLPWGKKTQNIDQRTINVYLPTVKMKEEWYRKAKKMGVSVSKFVIEHVENNIRQNEDNDYPHRRKLIERIKELEQEIVKLREENRLFRNLSERLDNELKRYRAEPFLEDGYQGIRKYDTKIVEVLRSKKVVPSDEILDALEISPKDTELVKAVNRQLENLERYGLVRYRVNRWEWVGGE